MCAVAGDSFSEQCSVRNIHVALEAAPGPARSEMGGLIETTSRDRGFQKTEMRENAGAFLTATVRIMDKAKDENSTFTAHLSAVLVNKAENEL